MGGGSSYKRIVHSNYAGTGSYNTTLNNLIDDREKKPKVFISFSMRDYAQVELLRHQVESENYDIEFIDNSLQNPVVGRSWRGPVGIKIEQSDAVICMIGHDTHGRPAVSWEVETAYQIGVPVIPVRVHRDRKFHRPEPIRDHGDRTIPWDLDKIQYQLNIKTQGE